MINDSMPWRAELHRIVARLKRRQAQRRWTEATFASVERDLMVGMFTIRRLVEAEKTSSLFVSRRVAAKVLPLVGPVPNHIDRWSPWEHFDFQSTRRAEIDVISLYHEFIHSFIFMLAFDEERNFTGVYVGSDRTKNHHIYEIPISQLIWLFDHVSCEHVLMGWNFLVDGRRSYRLSQHDLVEGGFAQYDELDRWWVTETKKMTLEFLRSKFPGIESHVTSRHLPG